MSVSGMKEREPAPKTAGRGGRRGVDREAACEFLFYCLTLLKKRERIKCFDPFWHFALPAALSGPELSPQPGPNADVVFRLASCPTGVWASRAWWQAGAGCLSQTC